MDDTRRILRFALPGLVFGIETLLWLFILIPSWIAAHVLEFGGKEGLGVAIASLLASGPVGYIFATVHHRLHWWFDRTILDHSHLINILLQQRRLPSQVLRPDEQDLASVDRTKGQAISLAVWYLPKSKDGIAAVAETIRKLDSLGDQAHALGATRVASGFSVLTALWIVHELGTASMGPVPEYRFWSVLVLGSLVTWLFDDAYRRVGRMSQDIYDRIFLAVCALPPPASLPSSGGGTD